MGAFAPDALYECPALFIVENGGFMSAPVGADPRRFRFGCHLSLTTEMEENYDQDQSAGAVSRFL